MVPTPSLPRLATTSLLIVYVNSSVGMALAQRLFDAADVTMAPSPEAIDTLHAGSRHDVVLMCPYLTVDERACVLSACDSRDPSPTVLEVADGACPPGAHVRVRRTGEGDYYRLLAALGLPLEA